ncbi:MAG TPA: hypothetical protein VFW60_02480 [Rhodanobacteraceae bacterium]|nr:hypothetical protein [Rhodanobacteraceae bacterium]
MGVAIASVERISPPAPAHGLEPAYATAIFAGRFKERRDGTGGELVVTP